MRYVGREVLVLALLSLLIATTSAKGDLIVNGDFESPAVPGNATRYSDNFNGLGTLDNLPGWTFPTAFNSFWLEHGEPFNVPRYHGGRQAVALNYDDRGTSIAPLAQTFATTPGALYTLRFAFNEENVSHTNSPTQMLVEVGSLSKTYHLDSTPGGTPSINGYTIYSANFTATSSSTTLSFRDVTPGSASLNSAILDDVWVNAVNVAAVPEPASIVLLCTGALVGLGYWGRRWRIIG